MDALKDQPGVVRVLEPEYRTFSIKMNTRHGALADIELRKAISYAFNYQAMLDAAGYADLMVGPLPNGILGHDPSLQVYRTDLDKAKEHLAKSKTPNGGIKLTMVHVSGLDQQRRWALVMLDSLKKLNIDLDIKPMIWPDMVASCRSPETFPDLFPVYQTANYGDPDNIAFAAYHSSRNGNWQNAVYNNPKVDALIEKGRSEQDEAKRKAIYKEFQEAVVADAPDIFGVLEQRKLAMRDTRAELRVHAGGVERGRVLPAVAEVMSHRRRAASRRHFPDPGARMLAFALRRIVLLIPVLDRTDDARLRDRAAAARRSGRARGGTECDAGRDRRLWQGVRSRPADRRAILALCDRPAARRLGRLDLHAASGRRRISPPTCRRRSNWSSRRCCSPSSIGIPAGLMAAVYRDRWPDYVSRVVSLGAISMPRFFLGLLLQLGFAMWLGLLPLGGRFPLDRGPAAARHRLPHRSTR